MHQQQKGEARKHSCKSDRDVMICEYNLLTPLSPSAGLPLCVVEGGNDLPVCDNSWLQRLPYMGRQKPSIWPSLK